MFTKDCDVGVTFPDKVVTEGCVCFVIIGLKLAQNDLGFPGKPKSRVFTLVGGGYYIGKVHFCSPLIKYHKMSTFQIDRRSKSDLVGLSSNLDLPVADLDSSSSATPSPCWTSSSSIRGLASESAKLEELERLLSKFR